jgi:hypothetical protein
LGHSRQLLLLHSATDMHQECLHQLQHVWQE